MKAHELIHELSQTSGIFGRKKESFLVFEGEGAYTDGEKVVLPAISNTIEFDQDTAIVLRGYVDHEAGHLRYTDFEALKKFALTNTPECKEIWNCLEDVWLERKVMNVYPGSEKNLRKLREFVGEKELSFMEENPLIEDDLTYYSVKATILRSGTIDYAGEPNKSMYSKLSPDLKAWGHKWVEEVHKCKNSSQIMNLAIEIERLINKSEEDKKESKPEEFSFDPEGDITQGNVIPHESKTKNDASILEDNLSKEIKGLLKKVEKDFFIDVGGGNKYTVLTDRFDEVFTKTSLNNRFDKRHAQMVTASISDYEEQRSALSGVVNTMKSKLRRALMSKETRDWNFGLENGCLDSKRLVSGHLGSTSIFKKRQDRPELDTSVHLLVDLSGSMGGEGKIELTNQVVISIAECLEGTSIRYQISGFDNLYERAFPEDMKNVCKRATESPQSSYERIEPLNLFIYKGFNEPLHTSRSAIGQIKNHAYGNNSDRDAVLWAAKQLKTTPQKRKILFVISDGAPKNNVIRPTGSLSDGLRNAIEDISKQGIECVAIGLLDDSVKKLYPNYVVVMDIKDFQGSVFDKLSKILLDGR